MANAFTPSNSMMLTTIQLSQLTQVCLPFYLISLARFSPDDVYQKERMKCKERFNLLPTQKPPVAL